MRCDIYLDGAIILYYMKHVLYCAIALISAVSVSARETDETGLLQKLREEKQAAYEKMAEDVAAVTDMADLVPLLEPIRIADGLSIETTDISLDSYVLIQHELGMPRTASGEIIDAVQQIAAGHHASQVIQDYFAYVDRLPVDPPRADDVRAWRFLFAEDVRSRLLETYSLITEGFPAAVHGFAEELARVDNVTAEHIMLVADYVQEHALLRQATLSWLAESLSVDAPLSFRPNAVPLSGFELGLLLQEHPAAAAAVAVLRRRTDTAGGEYRFFTNALRVASLYNRSPKQAAEICDGDTDSAFFQLLSFEDMEQYRRRASGIAHSVEVFSAQQGHSWRSDPRLRIEILGSVLAQLQLNSEYSVFDMVQDSIHEWIDGARILVSRRELISASGFPVIILLVESESAMERLVQSRNTWMQSQEALNIGDAGYSPAEWFAMHGLVILQLDYDDPLWEADAADLALTAAAQVANAADAVMYRNVFDNAFSSIAVADAAVRIAGLSSVWLEHRLQSLLWESELAHPAALHRKRQLAMYGQQLKMALSRLDTSQACLPALYGVSELAAQSNSWSSWLTALENSVEQVGAEVFTYEQAD